MYPITRGLGFVVMEGPGTLVEWGIKHVGRGDKNTLTLNIIEHLINRFDPHALVTEDWEESGNRRSARVKRLYRMLEKYLARSRLDHCVYPWPVVFQVFDEHHPTTRHDLAIAISDMLPAIKRRLPPKRKPWLPMDPRQALFDAAALGITHYAVNG